MVIPGWIPAIVALSIAAALALLSGLGLPRTLRIVLGFALVGAPLFVFQLWRDGVFTAIEIVADLLALIPASAVTASTTASEVLETLSRVARPLRHFGVSPERVALACSLAIRSIPLARTVAQETLQAARARGLERSPRAFATLRRADSRTRAGHWRRPARARARRRPDAALIHQLAAQLPVDRDRDVCAKQHAAGLERRVPGEGRSRRASRRWLPRSPASRCRKGPRRYRQRRVEDYRLRDATHRELTVDLEVAALDADAGRGEGQHQVAVGVEEVAGAQVRVAVGLVGVDRCHLGAAGCPSESAGFSAVTIVASTYPGLPRAALIMRWRIEKPTEE